MVAQVALAVLRNFRFGEAPEGLGFWPVLNQGALAAVYSFIFLYLSAAGGGPWGLDALRRGGRSAA